MPVRRRSAYTAELLLDSGTRYFSTHWVQTTTVLYEGTVLDMGHAEQSIPVPADIPRIGDCRIVLRDTNQEWRSLLGQEVSQRRLIRIKRRQEGSTQVDVIGAYEVIDWDFTQDTAIVFGKNLISQWMDKPLLANLINRTNFPDLALKDEAFPNLIYGRNRSNPQNPQGKVPCRPMPETDHGSPETVTWTRWCVACHPCYEVAAVYRREPGEGVFTLVSSGYTINSVGVTFENVFYAFTVIDFDTPQTPGTEIRADVDGFFQRQDVAGVPAVDNTGIGPLRNAVDHLLQMFFIRLASELHAPDFDTASFVEVRTILAGLHTSPVGFEYLSDGVIDEQITLGAAISQVLKSMEMYLTQNRQGEIALRIVVAGDPNRPVLDDTFHHLKLSVKPKLARPVYNRWRFYHDRTAGPNEWQYAILDNATEQLLMGISDNGSPPTIRSKIQEEVVYLPFVSDLATAAAVIARRSQFLALGSHRVEVKVPTVENYADLECGKLIGITTRFGIGPGGWDNAEFIITDVVDEFSRFESTVKGILRSPASYLGVLCPDPAALSGTKIYSITVS